MADREEQNVSVTISKKLVIINSISSLATRFLNIFVLLWMYQHLLARIPPDEFAIYPVVMGIMLFVPLFTLFLTAGVERHAVEAYALGDEKRVTQLVSSIFPLLAVILSFLMIGGLIFSWYIDYALVIPDNRIFDARLMMALLIFKFVVALLFFPFMMGFYIRQRFVHLNFIHIARDLFRITLLVILLLGVSTRVLWVVVAQVIADVGGVMVVALLSRQMVRSLRFNPALFCWETARWIMSFGIWITLARAGHSLQNALGPVVLNKLSTGVEVTAFSIANMFEKQINMTTTIAAGPLQPTMTAMHATGDKVRLGNTYLRGGRYAMWANMAVATPLAIYAAEIVNLYVGEVYSAAALALILLLARYPVTAGNTLAIHVAAATTRIRTFSIWSIISQIIGLGLMIYFVWAQELGAIGVALGVLISMSVTQVVIFWPLGFQIASVSLARFIKDTFIPGMVPAIAGGLVWYGLKSVHAPESWFQLGLFTIVGGFVYLLTLGFVLHADDKRDLMGIINKITGMLRERRERKNAALP